MGWILSLPDSFLGGILEQNPEQDGYYQGVTGKDVPDGGPVLNLRVHGIGHMVGLYHCSGGQGADGGPKPLVIIMNKPCALARMSWAAFCST